MKKRLLGLFSLMLLVGFSFSQTTNYGDWETIIPNFGVFGGATYETVDNPVTDGINTSAHCALSLSGVETWAGMWVPLGGTIDLSTVKQFKIKVLADSVGVFMLKLENASNTAENTGDIPVDYTTPGVWQELTYDLTGKEGTYSQIVVFPDFGETREGMEWWFDDIMGPDFIPGDNVDVRFQVTDLVGFTDIKMLFNNTGDQLQMYDDGTNGDPTAGDAVWTAWVLDLPGNTLVEPNVGDYVWDVYADGDLKVDDLAFSISAGQVSPTMSATLAPEQPDQGAAVPFDVIGTTPTIDGVIDDVWAQAPKFDLLKTFTGDAFDNADDLSAYWKAGWDEFGIYILVHVTADDVHFTDGTYGESYEQDIIEVYFDMNVGNLDDGNGPTPDGMGAGNGHYQIAFKTDVEGTLPTWATGSERALVLNDDNSCVQELFIDWLDIVDADGNDFIPDGESLIGFDVVVADNDGPDNGKARTRKVWKNDGTQSDEDWLDMDMAGELLCKTTIGVEEFVNEAMVDVYPNPVNENLHISSSNQIDRVVISNIIGQEVTSFENVSNTLDVNLKEFKTGLYYVTIYHVDGNVVTKKVMKK